MSKHVPRKLGAMLGAVAVLFGAAAVAAATQRAPTQPSSNYLGPPKQASAAHATRPQEANIPAALRSEPLPARPHKSNRLP